MNKKLLYFTQTDDYKKPENGRWWKNLIKWADNRYELLKKYSNETESWKIWYALKDETIWETLTKVWIKDWNWVSEWLLRKSWFDDIDIEDFRAWRLKSDKVTDKWQKEALKSMEKASEVVSNQVLNIETDLVNISDEDIKEGDVYRVSDGNTYIKGCFETPEVPTPCSKCSNYLESLRTGKTLVCNCTLGLPSITCTYEYKSNI